MQEKADEVKGKASERVRRQLNERSDQLGEHASSLAEALHSAGEHLEQTGNQPGAKVAHQTARQVEQLARYLQQSDSDRLLGDIERFGRQRPWAAGTVGVALGFVGARFLKASSEGRYQTSRRDADLPIGRDADATTALPSTGIGEYGTPVYGPADSETAGQHRSA